MRALVILSTGQAGGSEFGVATALAHRPDDIEVDAIVLGPGGVEAELERGGTPFTRYPATPPRPVERIRLVRALERELARARPDLVYAVGNKATIAAVLPCRLRRVPLVWRKGDFWYDGRGARLLARNCRRVIASSQAVGAALGPGRVSVIYSPVRLPAQMGRAARRPAVTIGAAGRLEPLKGHHHLLEAAAELKDTVPELRVVIAGAEPPHARGYADRLRDIARAAGMEDQVVLTGLVEDMEAFYARLTVYVSASYRESDGRGGEGAGLALSEASWSGLPVVATRSGGTDEVVIDEVTGLLVPPAAPTELARALRRILRDPELAASLGEAGRDFAQTRFSPSRCAAQLFEEWRSVVAEPEPPAAR